MSPPSRESTVSKPQDTTSRTLDEAPKPLNNTSKNQDLAAKKAADATSKNHNPAGKQGEDTTVSKTHDDLILDSSSSNSQPKKHPKDAKFATLPSKTSKNLGAESKPSRNKFNLSLKSSQSAVERPIYEGTPPTTPEEEKAASFVRPITPPAVFSGDDSTSFDM